MIKKLKNRIALVTGASRGIGRSVSETFAEAGAHVILLARDKKNLKSVKKSIERKGGTTDILPCDLSDMKSIKSAAKKLRNDFDRLDVFVGCAGMLGPEGKLTSENLQEWQKTINVNFSANFALNEYLKPLMEQSDAPRMIFVTSGAAYGSLPTHPVYGYSKKLLEKWAKTFIEEQNNYFVTLLDPGEIDTDMQRALSGKRYARNLPKAKSIMPAFVYYASSECDETIQRIDALEFKLS